MANPWTRVQAPAEATSTGTGSVAASWSPATTAGNLLIAIVAWNEAGSALTINAPSGWIVTPASAVTNSACVQVFYILNSGSRSGSETFTLSSGSTRDMALKLEEWSCGGNQAIDLIGPVSTKSKTAQGSSAAPDTGASTSNTVTAAGLVLGAIANVNNTAQSALSMTPTGTATTTDNATSGNATAANKVTLYCYQNLTTAIGTADCAATLATSRAWAATVTSFSPILDATAAAPTATATAAGTAPSLAAGSSPTAPTATATAAGTVPTPNAGSTVTAPVAAATADGVAPVFSGHYTAAAPVATATGAGTVPTVSANSTITAPVAAASANGVVPTVSAHYTATPPVATASAAGVVPGVVAGAIVVVPVATATGAGVVPTIITNNFIVVPVATATALGIAPIVIAVTPAVREIPGGSPFTRRKNVLGLLVHQFLSPAGTINPTVLDSFQAVEQASGGFQSASGLMDPLMARQWADIVAFPTAWRIFHADSGDLVWAGFLRDPTLGGGARQLSGQGWVYLAQTNVDRILYRSMYYGDWSDASGDPYNAFKAASSISLNSAGNSLTWQVDKGQQVDDGDTAGYAFWAIGNPLTNIAFTMTVDEKNPGGNNDHTHYDIRLDAYTGPNTPIAVPDHIWAVADGAQINYSPSHLGDMFVLRIRRNGTTSSTDGQIKITVTVVTVDGAANGDDSYSTSQVAADLGGRMGILTSWVQPSDQIGIPFDIQQGSYANGLDSMALLSDWRWLILDTGSQPILDFGPWSTRRWILPDPETPRDLQPLDRFNEVVVPFYYTPGQAAIGHIAVHADPDPFPQLLCQYPNLSGIAPWPNEQIAQSMGQLAINYLAQKRWSGTTNVSEVMDWWTGKRVSAHLVHAGDEFYLPTMNALLRGSTVTKTPAGASIQFTDGYPQLDTMLQRNARRMALSGKVTF